MFNSKLEKELKALRTLSYMIDLINQTVGDALSDLLLVELILREKGWNLVTWENSYSDLPNKQIKVKVKDRNVITTTDAERRCVTPTDLQPRIDSIVKDFEKGRSFVRYLSAILPILKYDYQLKINFFFHNQTFRN